MGELLGTGGFGEVRKALWRGTDVAVKTITSLYSNDLRNAFIQEVPFPLTVFHHVNGLVRPLYQVTTMTTLRHPNIILFIAAATKPPNLCIGFSPALFVYHLPLLTATTTTCAVMELMSLGSLYDVLHNELIPDIPTQLRIKILRQAAKGMYFLHSSGIVHGDLKSLNLLLDNKWNVKVSDFGLTRSREQLKMQHQLSELANAGGSIQWTAPEVLNETPSACLKLAEVYSFGIILWEVHTRMDPYPGMRFSDASSASLLKLSD